MAEYPQTVKLRERLAETLDKAEAVPLDLVMLFDASSSVAPNQFTMAKQAGFMLLMSLSEDACVGFGQFSDHFKSECILTVDKYTQQQAMTAMTQRSGGTNTAEALSNGAMAMLSRGRPKSLKYVFLFTDGYPNDQQATVLAANKVRNMGVTILGVGIGNVNQAQLEQVCGAGNVFILNDWQALISAIPAADARRSRHVPNSEISLKFNQTKVPVGFSEPLPFKIEIKNLGKATVVSKSVIRAEGGDFYEPEILILDRDIKQNEVYNVSISLTPTGNANINTLPEMISVVIMSPQNLIYKAKYNGFTVQLNNMVGDIYNWRPKYPVPCGRANILVFGIAGVGKSTFVNHLYSLYLESYENKAISYESADHVTIENEFHSALESFRFLDTVGLNLQTDNYGHGELEQIISGALPMHYKINEEGGLAKAIATGVSSKQEREIHACVVVVNHGFTMAEGSEKDKLKQFIHQLARANLNPIIAVTRIDEINDPDVLKQLPNQIKEATSIAIRDIFLLDNRPRDDVDIATRKTLYTIMLRLLNNATLNHKRLYGTQNVARPEPLAAAAQVSQLTISSSSPGKGPIIDQYTVQIDGGDCYDVYEDISEGTILQNVRSQIEQSVEELSSSGFAFLSSNTNNPIPRNAEVKLTLSKVLRPSENGLPPVVKIKLNQSDYPPPYKLQTEKKSF